MKERNSVLIISGLLIFAGIISFFVINIFSTEFNFYKSELKIDNDKIYEKLYYEPNKDYHTLYRYFFDPVYEDTKIHPYESFIRVSSVECYEGNPYSKDRYGVFHSFSPNPITDQSYTENNEYGCSFGNELGFKENNDYWISSEFIVHHKNLFFIDGKYYKKYIAYSKNKHKLLIKNYNFFIEGDIETKKIYLPSEYVSIYIPYNEDISGYNIISEFKFDFNSTIWFLGLIYFFLPGILFFIVWLFFGRELKDYDEVPEQLSNPPNERKPWEVAAYFHPPFSVMDNEFMTSMIIDLYHRKIIDIKIIDKKTYIKINDYDRNKIDDIESSFLIILKNIKEKAGEKYFDGDYFNLDKASKSWGVSFYLKPAMQVLQKEVKNKGKEYLDIKGNIIYSIIMFLAMFVSYMFLGISYILFSLGCLVITSIILSKSALLTRYKKEYYKEYQEWQAFRKWLSYSPSIKEHGYKGVIMWDKYLVYGAAIGISMKVLKELKNKGLITPEQYNTYYYVHTSSTSFSASSGTSGSGGGGGAGGGGAGGGGGGGR